MATPNPDTWVSGWDTANFVVLPPLDVAEASLVLVVVNSGPAGTDAPPAPTSSNLTFDLVGYSAYQYTPLSAPIILSLWRAAWMGPGPIDNEDITINGDSGDSAVAGAAVAYSGCDLSGTNGDSALEDYSATTGVPPGTDASVTINPTVDGGLLAGGIGAVTDATFAEVSGTDIITEEHFSTTNSGAVAALCSDHLTAALTPDSLDITLGTDMDYAILGVNLIPAADPPPTGDDPPLDDIYSMIL